MEEVIICLSKVIDNNEAIYIGKQELKNIYKELPITHS